MPETLARIFEIWVKWLYTGRIFLATETDSTTSADSKGNVSYEWMRWARCYALGDFLQDSDFKDAIVDAIVEAFLACKQAPFDLPSYIYPHSLEGSAHRKLAVDVQINFWNRERLGRADEYPDRFLLDVLTEICPKLATGMKYQCVEKYFDLKDTCKYHDHGPDKPCYKTKSAFRF
jgi:hypothetical protein